MSFTESKASLSSNESPYDPVSSFIFVGGAWTVGTGTTPISSRMSRGITACPWPSMFWNRRMRSSGLKWAEHNLDVAVGSLNLCRVVWLWCQSYVKVVRVLSVRLLSGSRLFLSVRCWKSPVQCCWCMCLVRGPCFFVVSSCFFCGICIGQVACLCLVEVCHEIQVSVEVCQDIRSCQLVLRSSQCFVVWGKS